MCDQFRLDGKVAMVTGASRGLGKAIALALAEAGADVVATARSVADIEETAQQVIGKGRRALALPVDVADTPAVEQAVERIVRELGRIDILVNNSGLAPNSPFLETTDELLRQVLETNVGGTYRCTRAVGRHMVAQRSGKVINIASIDGLRGKANLTAYCASKGAIVLLTQALAAEWARHNVQVNAIAPGAFHTAAQAAVFGNPELAEKRLRKIPQRRAGRPDEIGPMAVYLASKASDFVTGSVMVIDGGESAKL